MNELNLAVMLYLVTQGLDGGRAAMRLVPSTSIRHLLRARGNCCCMWVTIVADEATRRVDISVTGSPVAHTSRAGDVARFLELANDGDAFGAFGIEVATGAVYYASSTVVDASTIDADAIGIAVRTAGTRYDRLYPHLVEVINGADPDKLWPITEQPDWEMINREFSAVARTLSWGPPEAEPALGNVLRLPV